MKNEQKKSDPSIVAKRPANKPDIAEVDLWGNGTESAEPREGTEGNTGKQHTCRTPSRVNVSQGLERVREAAKQRKKERFTALLHHVTIDLGVWGATEQNAELRILLRCSPNPYSRTVVTASGAPNGNSLETSTLPFGAIARSSGLS
jgi:hypothetical protein